MQCNIWKAERELIVIGFSALESSELVLEIDYRGLWQASLHIQGFSFILRLTFTWVWNFNHIRRLKRQISGFIKLFSQFRFSLFIFISNCHFFQRIAEWTTVGAGGTLFSENYFEVRDQYSMGGQHVANLSTHFSWKQVKWLVSNFLSALKGLHNFLAACDKTEKHASLKIVANLLRLCLFVCLWCCDIVWRKKVKSRPLWLVFKKAQKRFLSTQHHQFCQCWKY